MTTGLFLDTYLKQFNSYLVLPIVLVTFGSTALVYAVGLGVVSKRLASVLLGIILVIGILAYYYLGRFTSIWYQIIVFAIFILLVALLFLADKGNQAMRKAKMSEKMRSK